jgi:hypothetical protein
MNERIRELAKEAAREMNETGTYSEPKFQEKFAELIVKECANMLDEDSYLMAELGGYAHDMRKRFGVEE